MDTNKLKELAEACGNLNWRFLQESWTEYAIRDDHAYIATMLVRSAKQQGPCPEREAKAKFLGAMTPATVLELIAEVERLRGQVDHLITQHMPREPIPEMPGWTRVIDADRLKAENEALRKIISECATACGAGCHPDCTLEFMAMLPDEIASVVGKRARNAAIGAVVWQFIDRMTDVCEQDPAERILEQFVAAVRPAIDAALEGGGR